MMASPTRAVTPVILPELNTLIRLTIALWPDPESAIRVADVPSRIEDVVPVPAGVKGARAQLLVACPHYDGDVEEPVERAFCSIGWTTPTGLWELPAAYLGKGTVGAAVPIWRVEVVGAARRLQRRNHVRVEWSFPVSVEVLGPPDEAGEPKDLNEPDHGESWGSQVLIGLPPAKPLVLDGRSISLSEGGMRVLVPPPVLSSGTKLRIRLAIGEGLNVPAYVVRALDASEHQTKPYQLVVAFENPDAFGDEIRHEVFDTQLKLRKLGRR